MQDVLTHFIAGFEAGAIAYIIAAFCSFSWNNLQSAPAMTELGVLDQVARLSVGTNLTQPNHLIQSGQGKTKQFKQRKLKLTESLQQQ